jgi:hypothetical protein
MATYHRLNCADDYALTSTPNLLPIHSSYELHSCTRHKRPMGAEELAVRIVAAVKLFQKQQAQARRFYAIFAKAAYNN